jgi:hypothetical protein
VESKDVSGQESENTGTPERIHEGSIEEHPSRRVPDREGAPTGSAPGEVTRSGRAWRYGKKGIKIVVVTVLGTLVRIGIEYARQRYGL